MSTRSPGNGTAVRQERVSCYLMMFGADGWEWYGLTLLVGLASGFRHRIFRGRILTLSLLRFCRVRWTYWRGCCVRILQLMGVTFAVSAFTTTNSGVGALVCDVVPVLLYFDDLLTGDDDEWRRFNEWARNKVRWLMQLPAAPEPGTA